MVMPAATSPNPFVNLARPVDPEGGLWIGSVDGRSGRHGRATELRIKKPSYDKSSRHDEHMCLDHAGKNYYAKVSTTAKGQGLSVTLQFMPELQREGLGLSNKPPLGQDAVETAMVLRGRHIDHNSGALGFNYSDLHPVFKMPKCKKWWPTPSRRADERRAAEASSMYSRPSGRGFLGRPVRELDDFVDLPLRRVGGGGKIHGDSLHAGASMGGADLGSDGRRRAVGTHIPPWESCSTSAATAGLVLDRGGNWRRTRGPCS
jgi:hypothetical protein